MSDQCWQSPSDIPADWTGDGLDAACAGTPFLSDTALACIAKACCVAGGPLLPTDAESPCIRLEPFNG